MKWSDFEHQMWAQLKAYDVHDRPSYLLAVSGGVDSMAMLQLMRRLRPQAKLRVAHYHHGPAETVQQSRYRDDVLNLLKHNILSDELLTEISAAPLQSESEMREARWKFLWSKRNLDEPVLTAHHAEDAFETTLLKMLRGTSLDGISAFQVWNGQILRPFLKTAKKDLQEYVVQHQVSYLDDPSNQQTDYLRNWIREKWLKDLEAHKPGSLKNFSLSMSRIIEEHLRHPTLSLKFFNDRESDGLDRAWFQSLSVAEQLKAVALFLKSREIFDFSRGQLQEILKRLDKNQKDITFEIFARKWVINASQIMLR